MGNFLDSIIKPVPQIKPGMEFPLDGLGDIPEQNTEVWQDQFPQDPLGMGGLPPASSYGSVQPSFNEKLAELAIGTSLKINGKTIENIDELPTLFYCFTDNWRHFQLSNLRKADQREILRDIEEIKMLARQDGNEYICKEKQLEIFDKIYLFKSRSDLDRMTEREIWTVQTNNMNQGEIKRPKDSAGGGLMSFFTGRNRGSD